MGIYQPRRTVENLWNMTVFSGASRKMKSEGNSGHPIRVEIPYSERIRFPARSIWNRLPGGMTVVALYSVMMAGPEYFLPG